MKKGRGRPPLHKPNIDLVLKYIESGLTEQQAILKTGYKNTSNFYKKITPEQKAELRIAKVAHKKVYGVVFGKCIDLTDLTFDNDREEIR